jgi:hypothetical protein
MNSLEAATIYISRGFAPVPIPARKKGPLVKNWQELRIVEGEVCQHFKPAQNIGIILGAASRGLVDIDLDCPEALKFAPEILPQTGATFGRASKPIAHALYKIIGLAPTRKFVDPVDGSMIVELRGDGGLQTIFPPSVHPSGESVTWRHDGEPATVEYDDLLRDVKRLAARVVVERHSDGTATDDPTTWLAALNAAPEKARRTVAEWLGIDCAVVGTFRPSNVAGDRTRHSAGSKRHDAYAHAALEAEVAAVASAGKGGRNDQVNRSAFNLGTLIGAAVLGEAEVEAALLAAALACGLSASEAKATIRSGLSKGKDHPREMPEPDEAEGKTENSDWANNDHDHHADDGDENSRADAQPREAPRPLRRELSPAEPFPIAALGDVLGAAAQAIIDKVQCPDAIAACSVLAAASMAVQAHTDVVLLATGRARPLSLFMCTVAPTGERKSAADTEALWPIRKREENLSEQYEAELPDFKRAKRAFDVAVARAEKTKGDRQEVEAALRVVGDEPSAPLTPVMTCGEPTLEGLHKLFAAGHPALGLFSDEGGSFIGGHAMSDETRLRTVAGLSSLWDGAPIRRIRAGDGASVLPGRRLAVHLMAQPDAAARMLSDDVLLDQGFLSRLLVAAPNSTAGTRFQKTLSLETEPALRRYGARLLDILENPPALRDGARNALNPRRIEFDAAAKARWLGFADYVEALLAPGKPLEPIRGFANKLPEHAARIAGVLTLVDDPEAQSICLTVFEQAIKIAGFFTSEALRLFEAGPCSVEMRQAAKLLEWLNTAWPEPLIGLSAIYRRGPNSIRDKATAKAAVIVLEDHGWLQKYREPHPVVGGNPVREAWRIVKEG